jgi:Domain of Unknown Function (DUF748)
MDDSAVNPVMARLRRHRLALAIVALLLILYALAGFLLVPHYARSYLQQFVQHDGGRQLELGALSFNPFTLTVEVHALHLKEADGRPIVGFDYLKVRASLLASAWHRAWTLSEIRLERPDIQVRIAADGTLNLSQLAPPETGPPPPPPPANQPLPALRIGRLSVTEGNIGFEDLSRGKPFNTALRPIEFSLQDFRTAPDFENRYRFEGTTTAGEQLSWSGQFSLQPLGSNGQFAITGLKATTIAAYLQDALPFDLPSGALDLKGEYKVTLAGDLGLGIELPSLEFKQIGIAPKGVAGDAPWIQVPLLALTGTAVSLAKHSVSVSGLLIDGAQISAWREPNGNLNLPELFQSHATAAQTASPAPQTPAVPTAAAAPAPDWAISVGTVTVKNASVTAEDRTVSPVAKVNLTPIGFTVSGFSNAPGSKLTIDSNIGFDGKGQLAVSGVAVLDPLSAELKVELAKLDLTLLQPYLNAPTRVDLVSGLLSVSSQVAYAAKPARGQTPLAVLGSVTIDELATRDRKMQQDLIKWAKLQISGINYQQGKKGLIIDKVQARDLYGRVLIAPDSSLNVKQLLAPTAAPAATPAVPTSEASSNAPAITAVAAASAPKTASRAPGVPVKINAIQIDNGSANFTDQSVQPTFSTGMVGLNGSIKGLSSDPASRARVDINGTVDRYAPVAITGTLNILSAALYTDLNVSFTNIDLTTFNPYSGTFVGYNISKGKLTTQFHYLIDNRKLDATHHIIVDQLEFGAATDSKKAVSLPVRFAVALLKDKDGVIDLTLPVGGSLDDPEFHVGPVIWQVLRNLLLKAVTAPFSALGHLFGGGEELSFVEFAPASSAIAPEQQQKLDKLVKGLTERPALKLDIPLQATSAADASAIAQATLDTQLHALPAVKPTKDSLQQAQQQVAALARIYQQALGAPPGYPPELAGKQGTAPDAAMLAARAAWLEAALLKQFTPDAAALAALGKARAEAVQAAVLNNTGIVPERVFLTERAPENTAPEGVTRLELKLQ